MLKSLSLSLSCSSPSSLAMDLDSCLAAPSGTNQFDQLLQTSRTKIRRQSTKRESSHVGGGALQSLSKKSLKRSRTECADFHKTSSSNSGSVNIKTNSISTTQPPSNCLSIELSYNTNQSKIKSEYPSFASFTRQISCAVTSDNHNLLESSATLSQFPLPTFVSKRLVSLDPSTTHTSVMSWSMESGRSGGGPTNNNSRQSDDLSKPLHQHILSCIRRCQDVIFLQAAADTDQPCQDMTHMNLSHILFLLLSLRAGLWIQPKQRSNSNNNSNDWSGNSVIGSEDYILIPTSPFEGRLIRLHNKKRKSFDVRIIPPSTIKKERSLSQQHSMTQSGELITRRRSSPQALQTTPRIPSTIKTFIKTEDGGDGIGSDTGPLSCHDFHKAFLTCLSENNPTPLQLARNVLPRTWETLSSTQDGDEEEVHLSRVIDTQSKLHLLRKKLPLVVEDIQDREDTTIPLSPSSLLLTRQELWDIVRARPSLNESYDKTLVRLIQFEILVRMQLYVCHGEDDFLKVYGKFVAQHSPTQKKVSVYRLSF